MTADPLLATLSAFGRTSGKAFHPDQPRDPATGEWVNVNQIWHGLTQANHTDPEDEPGAWSQAEQLAREQIPAMHVMTRVPPEVFARIVSDGRFLTQHDIGHSSGVFNPEMRHLVERVLHGDRHAVHPIYGYLHPDADGGISTDLSGNLPQYGSVAIRFKDDVKPDTTWTMGDSLDESGVHDAGASGMLSEPEDEAAIAHPVLIDKFGYAMTAPSPVLAPQHVSIHPAAMERLSQTRDLNLVARESHNYDVHYLEAQIHRPLSIDDIADVTIDGSSRDSQTAIRAAERAGIPYTVVGRARVVATKAFNPTQPRDPATGEWILSDLGPDLFHGSRYTLKPGDIITPGRRSNFGNGVADDRVYATDDAWHARYFADAAAEPEGAKRPSRAHVYLVQPLGPVEIDTDEPTIHSVHSREGFRVVKRVSWASEGKVDGGRIESASQSILSWFADVSTKFDPHELRDTHGRWARGEIGTTIITPKVEANVRQWMTERHISAETLHAQTRAILDRASPEAITYGTPWYQHAHDVAVGLGERYGVPTETAAAVLAATSPRNAWRREDDPHFGTSGNIESARQILDAARNPMRLRKVTATDVARASKQYRVDVSHLLGTRPLTSELTATEQSALDPRAKGLPDNKTKGFIIARHEGRPVEVLGGPKVRSFFNNINRVDGSLSATVDSHQVRAMIGRIDLPDKVYEEIASNPGRYQFFADVVRAVAAERGLPPHVVQAIVWEQWRLEHPDEVRKAENPSNIATARETTLGGVIYAAPTVAKTPRRERSSA